MKDCLVTLGCSFTYGEGLMYEVLNTKYPETLLKIPKDIIRSKLYHLSSMVQEFDEYRRTNNYSYFLNEKLKTDLITNGENGGRNVERLINLDQLIDYFEINNEIKPKYLIFQLTHIGRDIEDMLVENRFTREYIYKTYGNDFVYKVKQAAGNDKVAWDLDLLFGEAMEIFLDKLKLRFEILEKNYDTKCLFFFGLGSLQSIKENYNTYMSNPYFMELIHDDIIYYTWLDMDYKLNMNLNKQLGVNDDHPSSKSHKLIADKILKYLIKNHV